MNVMEMMTVEITVMKETVTVRQKILQIDRMATHYIIGMV